MVKKKRQTDPHREDDSSTESCDEKKIPNGVAGTSRECAHVKKSVDVTRLRKALKGSGLEPTCMECGKIDATPAESDEVFEYDKTLWLCLKCGSQLCGRIRNQHALSHYKTPRSDSHALAINTTTFEIWCYSCDNEVNSSLRKNLLECVEFVKKLSQKPQPVEENKVNNIESKILATLETMRPLLDTTSVKSQQPAVASTSGPPPPPPLPLPPIPGKAKRVEVVTTTTSPTKIDAHAKVDSLPRVRGLTNLGNTCFFNAVLQCLAQTPYLLDVLRETSEPGEEFILPGGSFKFKDGEEKELPSIKGALNSWGPLTAALADALEELQSGGGVYNPDKLFGRVTTKCPQFRGGDQEDSHELLRHLLESVRSEDLQRYQKVILQNLGYKNQDINLVSDEMKQKCKIYGQQASDRILRPEQVFRGFLVSTLTCQDCFHVSSRHENFLDMSLPVSVEKPPPPIRRKTSPESSPSVPSKHQQKKEKEKERKSKRAQKHHNKRLTQTLNMEVGAAGDTAIPTVPNNTNSASESSSSEQSDADVEDNLIDDVPKLTDTMINRNMTPIYDTNGNNQLPSPLCPEKRGDSPENLNKDSNDDENGKPINSGIATSPANPTPLLQECEKSGSGNVLVEVGISEQGANLVRQFSLTGGNENVPNGPGNCLTETNVTDVFEKLNIKETDEAFAAKKAKARAKRVRTQSHSDWNTTIAPRYQCKDGECSVQSCLNNFTAVELMTGNNKVGCDGCTKRINGNDGKTVYTNATKQYLISSPPAVLILHLKRFQFEPRAGGFRKLARGVTFPLVLDIAPSCASKVKTLPNIDRKQKKLLYALYGIVEHSGGMYGGHYTAYVKVRSKLPSDDKRWKFIPQGSKAELDQADEQRVKLEELMAKEKAREMRMKANDSDDFSSSASSSESEEDDKQPEGAVGGLDEPSIDVPVGKWYYVSDSRVQEVTEESVLRAQAYLLFYERIY